MAGRTLLVGLVAMLAAVPAIGAAGVRLSLSHEVRDGQPGIATLGGRHSVAVSTPDGAFVYATATTDAAVTVFSRDLLTGALTLVEAEQPTLPDTSPAIVLPNLVAISPDGTHVYVFGKGGSGAFSRDAGTGHLTFLGPTAPGLLLASGAAFSPDGTHVYVSDQPEDAVRVYARDGLTGQLTLTQTVEDGDGGALLADASAVAISPDGATVYVTSDDDDALVVFTLNPSTGELTLLEQHVDETAGVEGLGSASTVVVSPDGAHVYVGGRDPGLAVFERSSLTGALAWIDAGQFPYRAERLAMGANGDFMVAQSSSGEPDLVLLIARDLGTGDVAIASVETFRDNHEVAIGQDGLYAYAGSSNERHTVGVFRIIGGTCGPPAAGCGQPTQPLASTLVVKALAGNPQLQWKWTKGSALAIADFASPQTLPVDVRACLYDASDTLLVDAVVPALASSRGRACWKQSSNGTTLKYSDSYAVPEGVRTFRAKAGAAGFSSLKLKMKGDTFVPPFPPLATPVRLQIRSGTGACWEATYGTPQTNLPGLFKARSD
jgi:6-phosphogluconolactonase (cycloisomerase 2 family)